MKPILIFDYDGTLHQTLVIYESSFKKTLAWLVENGYTDITEVPIERIASWLGVNAQDMWNSFLPELPEDIKQKVSLMTGEEMANQISNGKALWFTDAEEVLSELKRRGYDMYVLSNCKIKYRDVNYKAFDMGRFFTEFVDCESYGFAPKTEIIKDFQEKHPGDYIVIGDRDKDKACAAACGAKFIGCAYGYGTPEELKGADYIINDIKELLEILK